MSVTLKNCVEQIRKLEQLTKVLLTELSDTNEGVMALTLELESISEHYKSLFENSFDGIYQATFKGKYLAVNPALAQILGYDSPEEVISSIKQIGVDIYKNTERYHQLIERIRDEKIIPGFVSEIQDKNGNHLVINENFHIIVSPDGQIIGYEGVMSDITEQVAAQELLASRQKELQQILDGVTNGVITMDEHGNILNFNQAAQSIFGYTGKEIEGSKINSLISKNQLTADENFIKKFFNVNAEQRNGFGIELLGERKNGDHFPILLMTNELPGNAEGSRRFIVCCNDITQQKQQEEQLRRTQKADAIGTLTGGIAHDFNNILGIIIGYSEMLLHQLDGNVKGFAQEIYTAGERGAKLTGKLLSFTRNKEHEASVTNINDLLKGDQDMLAKTLTPRISIHYELEDDLWDVWLDKNDLEDALLNICINALHAMGDRGKLTLLTSNIELTPVEANIFSVTAGDFVKLSISDTGKGMDEKTKEQIFDPFFTTKGDKGTGLGLSQVAGFVRRSRGAIKVYSDLGYGTKMTLLFPKYISPDVNEVIVPVKRNSYQQTEFYGTETILVVDDEPALRKMAKEILTQHGYQVLTAEGGKQALEIIEQEHVDLLLSDIIMQGMDGYQLAAQVKQHYPHILIQLASGFSDDRVNGYEDNNELSQNKINKPYISGVLLARIRDLLGNNENT